MFKSIKIKIILFLSIISIIFAFVIFLMGYLETRNITRTLNLQKHEKNILLNKSINNLSNNLKMFSYDYSVWDEVVIFLETKDLVWAKNNLNTGVETYKVNYIWVFDLNYNLVYSFENKIKFNPFNKSFFENFIKNNNYFNHFFVKNNDIFIEVMTAPIQPSNDIKRITPPKGYFIAGMEWNEEYIKNLEVFNSSKIELVGFENKKDFNFDKTIIVSNKILYSYDSKPVAKVYAITKSTLITKLMDFISYKMFVFFVFALLIVVLIVIFLNMFLNKPINIISNTLKTGNLNELSKLERQNNEFSNIAHLIIEFFNQKKQLEQTKNDLETANKIRDEFITNISHEIRTPINAIIGFSELLKDSITIKKYKDYLNGINLSSNNLLLLVDDMINLTKLNMNIIDKNMDIIDISVLCDKIGQFFYFKIKDKKLNFIIDLEQNLPNKIYMNECYLRQILINLLSNGLKFTQNGFVKLTIKHNLKENNLIDLILIVEDSGIGITEETKSNIFKIFYQKELGSTRKYEGLGLGLPIVKKLLDYLNGEIEIESELNKGSKFKIIIKNILLYEEQNKKDTKINLNLNDNNHIDSKTEFISKENFEILITFYKNKIAEVKSKMSIDEISLFAENIKEFAIKNNIKTIENYSEKLIDASNSFNIDEINELLSDFDNVLKLLEIKNT